MVSRIITLLFACLALTAVVRASTPGVTAGSEVHISGINGWSVTSGTINSQPLPPGVAVVGYGLQAESNTLGVTRTHSSSITFQFTRSTANDTLDFTSQLHIWGSSYSTTGYAESIAKLDLGGGGFVQTLSDKINGFDDVGYNTLDPAPGQVMNFHIILSPAASTASFSGFNVFVKARK